MAVVTIEPLAARQLHSDDSAARLIDVRTPAEFSSSHIAGSQSVPLDRIDAWARREAARSDDAVTLVCASGVRAGKAAAALDGAGFARVSVLAGGLKGWAAAGLPIATGEGGAISLERQVRILAGSLVVLGVLLAWAVTPYAMLLSLFVGAGLVFAGVTDTCGMGLLLAKAPWNRTA